MSEEYNIWLLKVITEAKKLESDQFIAVLDVKCLFDKDYSATDAVRLIAKSFGEQDYLEWLIAQPIQPKNHVQEDLHDRLDDVRPRNKKTGKYYKEDQLDEWDKPFDENGELINDY
jgi:hypothetical protein